MKRFVLAALLAAWSGAAWADAFNSVPPPGSPFVATGTTAARTPMDRAADVVNVRDYGAKCDGSTDDAAAIQAAVNYAAANGRRVIFGGTASVCVVNSAITVPSNSDISGWGVVTVKAGVSGTIFSATNASSIYIHDLTLNGNYPTTTAFQPVIWFTGTTASKLDNLSITAPAGEIRLTTGSNGNVLSRLTVSNSHLHAVAITSSNDNTVRDSDFTGQAGFGVIITTGASNVIQNVHTAQSGLELVGITKDSYDNRLIGNEARNTGDNCYSVTGYRNLVVGNIGIGCQGNGLTFYGSNNTATSNIFLDNAQGNGGNGGWSGGITVQQGFGGLGQHNVAVGNILDDDQVAPTQLYGGRIYAAQYTAWASGATVNPNDYRYNGLVLYQAAAGGTTGATAPTCTNGSCSDGAVTWNYINSFDGSVQPDWNTFANNDVRRFGTSPLKDNSAALHNRGLACLVLETAASTGGLSGNTCTGGGGAGSVVAGQFHTVTGGTAYAFGSSNTVSGGSGGAFGSSHIVDANYANAFGKQAHTHGVVASLCLGGTAFASAGDRQECRYVLGANITTTSATRLTTDGTATQAAGNLIAMPDHSLYEVTCKLIARNQSTGDGAEFSINDALFRRDTGVASVAPIGSTAWTTGPASAAASGILTPTLIADTTFGGVAVSVTASSGSWHVDARCNATQVQ